MHRTASRVLPMHGSGMWKWKGSRCVTSTTSLRARKPRIASEIASRCPGSGLFASGSETDNPKPRMHWPWSVSAKAKFLRFRNRLIHEFPLIKPPHAVTIHGGSIHSFRRFAGLWILWCTCNVMFELPDEEIFVSDDSFHHIPD